MKGCKKHIGLELRWGTCGPPEVAVIKLQHPFWDNMLAGVGRHWSPTILGRSQSFWLTCLSEYSLVKIPKAHIFVAGIQEAFAHPFFSVTVLHLAQDLSIDNSFHHNILTEVCTPSLE